MLCSDEAVLCGGCVVHVWSRSLDGFWGAAVSILHTFVTQLADQTGLGLLNTAGISCHAVPADWT